MADELAPTTRQVKPHAPFETGWFPVRNEVIDALMRYCTPSAFMVYMVILRKTLGWHKSVDWISYSQIQKLTGLSRSATWSALSFLLCEPNPRKPNPKKPETIESIVDDIFPDKSRPKKNTPRTAKAPTYKLINAITVGKLGDQKTFYSLNPDLILDIPIDEPEQPAPVYYQGDPEINDKSIPVAKSNQSVGVVAKCNQSGCKMQPTIDTIQKTKEFDDDKSQRISEILIDKTTIKHINQQTINDLKELLRANGLTIDDLLAGIEDHASHPDAKAPTFSDIKGAVRWATNFKRKAQSKRKVNKLSPEYRKAMKESWRKATGAPQDDELPEPTEAEIEAWFAYRRKHLISIGYKQPDDKFPENDDERNQEIEDLKLYKFDNELQVYAPQEQEQEAIPF